MRLLARALGLTVAAAGMLAAAAPSAAESDLKAAMIFNFTKFIEWSGPRGDGRTPLTIGVVGDDGIRDALTELVKERANTGRAVLVRRVEQPVDGEACHLLFVGRGVKKRQADFLGLARRGVVTIGDAESFVAGGGVLGFLVAENKLRFDVNLVPVSQTGVTISSRLLRLAREVKQ